MAAKKDKEKPEVTPDERILKPLESQPSSYSDDLAKIDGLIEGKSGDKEDDYVKTTLVAFKGSLSVLGGDDTKKKTDNINVIGSELNELLTDRRKLEEEKPVEARFDIPDKVSLSALRVAMHAIKEGKVSEEDAAKYVYQHSKTSQRIRALSKERTLLLADNDTGSDLLKVQTEINHLKDAQTQLVGAFMQGKSISELKIKPVEIKSYTKEEKNALIKQAKEQHSKQMAKASDALIKKYKKDIADYAKAVKDAVLVDKALNGSLNPESAEDGTAESEKIPESESLFSTKDSDCVDARSTLNSAKARLDELLKGEDKEKKSDLGDKLGIKEIRVTNSKLADIGSAGTPNPMLAADEHRKVKNADTRKSLFELDKGSKELARITETASSLKRELDDTTIKSNELRSRIAALQAEVSKYEGPLNRLKFDTERRKRTLNRVTAEPVKHELSILEGADEAIKAHRDAKIVLDKAPKDDNAKADYQKAKQGLLRVTALLGDKYTTDTNDEQLKELIKEKKKEYINKIEEIEKTQASLSSSKPSTIAAAKGSTPELGVAEEKDLPKEAAAKKPTPTEGPEAKDPAGDPVSLGGHDSSDDLAPPKPSPTAVKEELAPIEKLTSEELVAAHADAKERLSSAKAELASLEASTERLTKEYDNAKVSLNKASEHLSVAVDKVEEVLAANSEDSSEVKDAVKDYASVVAKEVDIARAKINIVEAEGELGHAKGKEDEIRNKIAEQKHLGEKAKIEGKNAERQLKKSLAVKARHEITNEDVNRQLNKSKEKDNDSVLKTISKQSDRMSAIMDGETKGSEVVGKLAVLIAAAIMQLFKALIQAITNLASAAYNGAKAGVLFIAEKGFNVKKAKLPKERAKQKAKAKLKKSGKNLLEAGAIALNAGALGIPGAIIKGLGSPNKKKLETEAKQRAEEKKEEDKDKTLETDKVSATVETDPEARPKEELGVTVETDPVPEPKPEEEIGVTIDTKKPAALSREVPKVSIHTVAGGNTISPSIVDAAASLTTGASRPTSDEIRADVLEHATGEPLIFGGPDNPDPISKALTLTVDPALTTDPDSPTPPTPRKP